MTNKEIEERLKKMREVRDRTFPDFMKNPVLDGKEISWAEFKEEEANLKKMHLEIMKSEDGWYYYTPAKEIYVESGKVLLGVCRGIDRPNLMLVYRTVKAIWDNERANYSGRELQSDEWGIYERVPEGAIPSGIAEGKYQLREVYDTCSCRALEELYAELRRSNAAE